MRIEVTAAGFTTNWLFPGSRSFDSWAQGLPWWTQGGLGVIRTADVSYQDALCSAIARSVRGLHAERGFLDVRVAPYGGSSGGPFASILQSLDITATLSPFEAREPLRIAFQDRAYVFVLTEGGHVPNGEWDSFVSLVEHFGKSSPPIRLCAVVLDSAFSVVSEPSFDFSTGTADLELLSLAMDAEDLQLWQAYLHQRACWEAAGSPNYAAGVGELLAPTGIGDDEAVEVALNTFALATAGARLNLSEVGSLVGEASSSQRNSGRQRRAREDLQRLGVLWRPPPGNKLEVLPWVSRALLQQPNVPDATVWTLRHNLVCAPLANEVISHCLRAEAQIRTFLHGKTREDAPQKCWESLRRYVDGKDDFVQYPNGYPFPPTRRGDVWAFASLGETLSACDRGAVADIHWDTLRLRNALMHGHYVNWTHMMQATRQAKRFDIA